MDSNDLRELATNALIGHWPPHLGVNTDAERIEFLARKLESAADEIGSAEKGESDALERVEALEGQVEDLEYQIQELKRQKK